MVYTSSSVQLFIMILYGIYLLMEDFNKLHTLVTTKTYFWAIKIKSFQDKNNTQASFW